MAAKKPIPYKHIAVAVILLLLFILIAFIPLEQTIPPSIFPFTLPWSYTLRWLLDCLVLALLCVVVGHRTKNRLDGIFIDERNKISLSRFQLIVWTIVLLTTLSIMVGIRLTKLTTQTEATNITFPETLFLLAGISVGSAALSPAIRNGTQADKNPDLGKIEKMNRQTLLDADAGKIAIEGNIVKNTSTRDAEWADMIRSELVGSEDTVDISKLQNFLFTVIIVLVYATAILQNIATGVTDSLPPFSDSMITLLGISHAGYLISKGTQSVPQQQT